MELTLLNILGSIVLTCLAFGLIGYIQFKRSGLDRFPWEPPPKTAKQLKQEAKRASKKGGN